MLGIGWSASVEKSVVLKNKTMPREVPVGADSECLWLSVALVSGKEAPPLMDTPAQVHTELFLHSMLLQLQTFRAWCS